MSVVMRSPRAFSEENGRLPCATSVRSCNCCPYGYHIDLDFVRYCESLANAKPTEEQLRRRSRRRSRKSMEFMLGLESLFDQWDAADRVQMVPEAPLEREPESPRMQPPTHTSTPYANHISKNNNNNNEYKPRANSVPRFSYGGGLSRSESPFATSSSTCSSLRGGGGTDGEAPPPPFPQRRPTNSPPETRAFLHDALDEVCSDFERTLERASTKRKKAPLVGDKGGGVGVGVASDRNNNSYTIATSSLSNGKRTCNTWEEYVDALDSCVSGNKSPPRSSRPFTRSATLPLPPSPHKQRPNPAQQQYESYVQATVAANAAKSALEARVPPPPPPRRHVLAGQTPKLRSPTPDRELLLSPTSTADGSAVTGSGSGTDAQTLFNIRQQMALSLKRMKDLEEQVKTIPELQSELTQLRDEKQRLQSTLQRKDDELQRARESSRLSSTPSPVASLKQASPVQFMPQRISPISLESLGARLRTNSTSSERQLKSSSASPSVLKRDVGVMCGQRQPMRDIAVGSPAPPAQRSVGTSPAQALGLDEELFTHRQLVAHVERALQKHEAAAEERRRADAERRRVEDAERRRVEDEERRRADEERRRLDDERRRAEEEQRRRARLISVGTQMYVPKREMRDGVAQTPVERPPAKYSVAVTAQPKTRESFVSCRPDVRSVGCSETRIDDILCDKCAASKRSVACGTDELIATAAEADELAKKKKKVSLRLLEAVGRSNTFSVGEHEASAPPPLLKRKSVGTQATPVPTAVHSVGQQTAATVVHAVGVQHVPRLQSMATQCSAATESRQTDTRGLIRLCATQTSTEEIATPTPEPPPPPPSPAKPVMRSSASMTEVVRTTEHGVNTLPPPPAAATRHAGSNTEVVRTRDMACGDAVKPHISIACADNYCDSCKDAIRHLAKDFTKAPAPTPTPPTPPSPVASRAADSRIPRPTHLASPSPVRKKFQRQNTYTITPSPTPSPVAEKKNLLSSLSEKPVSKPADSDLESSLAADTTSHVPATVDDAARPPRPRQPSVSDSRAAELDAVFFSRPPKTYELSHSGSGDLIVKEETRVRISWSRDASPAPLSASFKDSSSSSASSALTRSADSDRVSKSLSSSSPEQPAKSAKGATSKPLSTATPISSQSDVTETTDETVVEVPLRQRIQPSKELWAALKTINESLRKPPSKGSSKSSASASVKSANATLQKEWFRVASNEDSSPNDVDDYLLAFKDISVPLLEYCVNLTDSNGNTAMHYAVSHGNFEIVSSLLDSKVCNVNQMNNAGYTCVMLVTLAKLENALHRSVVQRLFQMADVNIRAKKHCQTALMLAVSHGNLDMVEMLLTAGADINLQDEDGSTALMCAAEHGRVDIVKHLLSQPDCDSLIQDVDGSTAFKIAWHAGHKDIGLLLYVHEQMLRSKMPNKSEGSRTPSLSPRHHKRQPSQ